MDLTDIQEAFLFSSIERFASAAESIAQSLFTLSQTARLTYEKQNPENKKPREPVVTRVKSEEDELLEKIGITDTRPIASWLGGLPPDEEDIGTREREFLSRQAKASASAENPQGNQNASRASTAASGDSSRQTGARAAVEPNDKGRRQRNGRRKGGTASTSILD